LISSSSSGTSARRLGRFTTNDLLRGLFRSEYEADTLRGNLGLPVPENVHTVARAAAEREEQPVLQ
jgi:hypothetical protein